MAFNPYSRSGSLVDPQDVLWSHLDNAKKEMAKRGDTPSSMSRNAGVPTRPSDSGFDESGGAGEFHQAARDPENFPYFGDFLGRMREFDANVSGGEDFA